jgi:hypothetical protein
MSQTQEIHYSQAEPRADGPEIVVGLGSEGAVLLLGGR